MQTDLKSKRNQRLNKLPMKNNFSNRFSRATFFQRSLRLPQFQFSAQKISFVSKLTGNFYEKFCFIDVKALIITATRLLQPPFWSFSFCHKKCMKARRRGVLKFIKTPARGRSNSKFWGSQKLTFDYSLANLGSFAVEPYQLAEFRISV